MAPRGDCRLDRLVSIFLSRAGSVYMMLVGKILLSLLLPLQKDVILPFQVEWWRREVDFCMGLLLDCLFFKTPET